MRLVAKLDRLAVDMRAIADGNGPSAEELDRAPLLLNWQRVQISETALEGLVLDHPRLGTVRVKTSLLFAINQDEHWARTLSRYYRLG